MRPSVLILAPMVTLCAAEVREEIYVVVNGHIITKRSYQQAVEQESASLYRQLSGKQLDEKLKDTREKTLADLIDTFIIEDKAADLGIQIPDEYIRFQIEEIKKQNKFSSDADLERALRTSAGISLPDFIKRQKKNALMQEVLRKEVYAKIAIEDQELRAYYEDHKDEYRQPSRFRIRELVIPKGATPEEQQAAQGKLKAIQDALARKTAFEELVQTYSESPSKATGGDLGWMDKGLLRESIEQAALTLKPGGISAPIETDKDYHVVQLLAAEMDVAKPFADVRAQILEKLQEPKAQNAIQNYLSALRVRANIRYMVPKETILKGW